MDASIVIPVKNGGELFEKVLEAVNNQKTEYQYEVICVDSGSTDGSVEVAKRHGCILKEIAPEEFGHGKTRNLGASLGTGEFILFLTQDAMPASNTWLQSFLDAMKQDEKIAGGFGKHLPYPECNIPDQQMLENHFARYGNENFVHYLDDEHRQMYEKDEQGYQQYLAFFSDNCSCLRRSVWEKIPYDDMDYAEDQAWSKKILEAGYKKVYCPDAAVYHSHDYPLASYRKRYYDDFKAVYRIYDHFEKKTFLQNLRQVLGETRYQCGYIYHRTDLSAGEKMHWYWYAFRRNIMKQKASNLAMKYYQVDEQQRMKMDETYSQQYVQIRE